MRTLPFFRRRPGSIVLSCLLGMVGCAQQPALDPLGTAKGPAHYRFESVLLAPAMAWPSDQWWQGYDDKQLNGLIAEALRDSPDMAMAAARLRRAEAAAQGAEAAQLPQVSLNGSLTEQKMSYNYLFPKAAMPQGWKDQEQVTLNFAWEIDFWGRNRAAFAAATSQLDATRAEAAQARLALTASVAIAYAELARLFAARDIAARTVEVRSAAAQLTAERFEHGLDARNGVRHSDAARAAAETEVLLLDEQIGLQRNRLAALLGAGPDRGQAIARPQLKLSRGFGLPAQLALNLLGRRPDIVAARMQAEAQSHRVDQKQAEFYPNVNLVGFLGLQSLGLDLLTRRGSSIGGIGPAVSLPIFSGGRLEGELKGNQAAFAETVANYDRTVTQALQQVADVTLSQKALAAQIEKAQEGVAAARDIHRSSRDRHEGGVASYLEVLMAEDSFLAGQRTLTNLQSRAFTLDVALMHALGGGYASSKK